MKQILAKLVDDADLVAGVGVRLGRIKDEGFLAALDEARKALGADAASPSIITELQRRLNGSIKDLAPITLEDLRSGWTPYSTPPHKQIGTILFGIFSFILIVAAAYATQVYDRARSLYSMTLELQEARGAEQAIRLFGLLKRNQQDVVESLVSGKKDFLYEAFSKSLFDLEVMNLKFQAYMPIATEVLRDLDMWGRVSELFHSKTDLTNPTGNPTIAAYLQNYGQPPQGDVNGKKALAPLVSDDLRKLDVQSLMNVYIDNLRAFNSVINVGFDPLAPNDYSFHISQLRYHMAFLGSWLLPGLYGMLGAVIFHMRRLLDPSLPNPSWLRFAYRIVLGGFAGIIIVWFWTPSSPKLAQPEFATLTAFGVAFLVGFSTDVFFQALDRLVSYLSQAVGQAGTRPAQ